MNTHTEQAKAVEKTKTNHAYTTGYDKSYLKYQALGEKSDTLINYRKTELSSEMLEVFYFCLLPVTCRDWMQK